MADDRRGVSTPKKDSATTGILRMDSGRPRRSSVDFRGVPDRLSTQVEPTSPQPSVDRLSVTFAEVSDCSDSSVKVNVFDPGLPPSRMDKVRFCRGRTASDGGEEEEDDYSASVSVIMHRRESMRRASSRKKKRRSSSPFSAVDVEGSMLDDRRRSSIYTNSSFETAISVEEGTTQEQIFENIRLHKEVLSNAKLQPWGMRRKIKLVQQAKAYVKRHEGELQERLAMSKSTKDILARFNIWLIKKLQYLRRELANTMTLLIPWELRIKEIESHFGSAVASYFTFLRWMFWVNLVITIILACFVAIPEMLTADVKSAGERKEMLPEEKLTATNLGSLWDFEGILKYSPIFYGYYTNKDGSGTGYRLPFAYFMTGLAVYVYSFVATLRRMAENSRMSKLSEKDDECIFTWKLFTGWDYMIGNAETAHNRVASLILGFKEALLEETERKKVGKNWKVICIRVLVNFLVVGLLAFSAYVVFIVVERSTEPEADDTWWRQNEITVSLSIISWLFPIFFEGLGLLEGYHPRKSLRIQLARIMVLNLLNLYTLIFSQFWKISKMAIELQSLKANYSATYGDAVLPQDETQTTCNYVAVNCSPATTTEKAITAVLTSVANVTISSIPNSTEFDSNSTFLDYDLEPNSTNESTASDGEELTTSPMPFLMTAFYNSVVGPMNNSDDWVNDTDVFSDGSKVTSTFLANASDVRPSESGTLLRNATTTVATLAEDYSRSPCYERKCEPAGGKDTGTRVILGSEITGSMFDMETRRKLRRLCWETMFGQELVKLTVMDLVLTILSIMLLDFFRAVFVRVMNNCWCWDLEKKFPQYGNFKIAENILHLVNNQGMVWMGMFFSPGLPAINLIKLVIMMYLRSWAVLTCNVPHEVVFRASRSNNFYLALLLTMLFLCVLPVGFAIVWIEPSWHCGPFSDYKRIYHLFTESLQRALPKTLHKALDYIASPGIIIPLLMLLILIIYYLISLTNSLREANNDLKIQLRRERTEERRKMFQLVDKRARKGSKDSETPFAKWKKLLPELSPRPAAPAATDVEKGEKTENGTIAADFRKDINRKELLTRFMKKALRKSSGTSDEDTQIPDEVTDGEQHESSLEEGLTKLKRARQKTGNKALRKPEDPEPKRIGPLRKSPGSIKRSSIPSDWSDNIPVIKISKTESEECILQEEIIKVDVDEEGREEMSKTGKFKQTVEEQIRKQIKNKEQFGEQLERKAIEMRMEVQLRKVETKMPTLKEVTQVVQEQRDEVPVKPKKVVAISTMEDDSRKNEPVNKCPIATEETVSSDLDLSQVSLVAETDRNDANRQDFLAAE